MIDWIHDGCCKLGAELRALYCGKDGWPPRSMLAKMIEEGSLGAAAIRYTQYVPSYLSKESVKFNNALKTLSEEDREFFLIDYVVIGKGKVKAARIGIARSTYYGKRDALHAHLSQAFHRIASGPDKKAEICTGEIRNEIALCV